MSKAVKVFDDELEIRIGSVLPERSLKQVAATLADLRAAYRASVDSEFRRRRTPATVSMLSSVDSPDMSFPAINLLAWFEIT